MKNLKLNELNIQELDVQEMSKINGGQGGILSGVVKVTENFEEYMRELGVSMITRKMGELLHLK